ncbi:MAG: hypothetical protein ACRDRN_03615 [Sciscionella sp.]
MATGVRARDVPTAGPAPQCHVRGLALDLLAVLAGVGLVVAAAVGGWVLIDKHVNIFLWFPPLLASWAPHVGVGTVPSVVIAALVVLYGPALAERLRWRSLLPVAYLVSVGWTLCLALVDGYSRGIAGRLTDRNAYLHDVPLVHSILGMLRHFSDHILTNQPHHWTTHVGAHPPGVFLVYLVLDRIGLGGGGAAGIFTILLGASACVAVAVTLRALGAGRAARVVLPFGVLLPGAVWVGVSADGMFAGVLAWGVALLAVGARGRGWRADVAALGGGLLLGYTLYLSYGLALAGLLPLVVIAVTRRWRAALFGLLGAGAVVAAFTASGFWWLTGYQDVKVIYALSIAKSRPYSYFVWADLAAFCFAIGPAALAGLRRLASTPRRLPAALGLLAAAALLAVLIADVSGMSKAEVERIWLPFAVWLMVPCALLPRPQVRWWLAAQAVLALLVNHLLLTVW